MTGDIIFRKDDADEVALMLSALALRFAHQPEFFPVFLEWAKKDVLLPEGVPGAGDVTAGEAFSGWIGKVTPGALCEAHNIIGFRLFPEEALSRMLRRLTE